MAHIHLGLQGLEVIGEIGFDLPAHALARPLLEAIKLPVDVHCAQGSEWNSFTVVTLHRHETD